MKLRKIVALLLAFAMVIVLAACSTGGSSSGGSTAQGSGAADDDTITIRFASGNPSHDHFYTVVNQAWYNYIEEQTGGKIKFEGYYDQTLTPQENTLEATKNGLVDIGEVYSAFWGDMFPLYELFFFPFQYPWPDGYTFHHAVAEMIETHPEYVEQVENQGVKFVMLHGDGIGQIISTKKYSSVSDLKGQVINAGSQIDKQLFESLGAAVEILSSGEIYDNLAKGVIDGTGWSINGTWIFSLQDVAKYMYRIDGSHQAWLYVMNQDLYDSLPAEYQQYFDFDVSKDFMYLFGYVFAQDDQDCLRALTEEGMEMSYPSDADHEAMVQASLPIIQDWKDRVTALGYDGDKLYEDWNAIVNKYNKGDDFTGMKQQLIDYGVTDLPEYFK